MRVAHYFFSNPTVNATIVTDDFGRELVVIPDPCCEVHWADAYDTQVVNPDSWGLVLDFSIREFE